MSNIGLGFVAKDLVTGMRGVITCKAENYGSATRWSLQLFRSEGEKEYPNAYDIDEIQLALDPETQLAPMVEPSSPLNLNSIDFGEEAEDTVTGFKGIVTAKYTFLNGCVHYRLETKPTKVKPGTPVTSVFPSIRIRRVGKGVADKHPHVDTTGGPVTRSVKVWR